MELPKNITQIGEADKHCRIYVEDYVVSYIKQMNGMAQNKDIAIALYGRKTAEDGVAYLFAYGSAKLNFLQKPVRHLSQAQEQEIEKLRRKYFSEMTFLGYQILNGEMVEGFQICEQEICRGMHSSMRRMTVCWHICWRTGAKRRHRRRWIRKNTKW